MTYIPAVGGGSGLTYAATQPSTGAYVAGDLVFNSTPAPDANKLTLLGWSRLTTGSGHVTGTDWAPLYSSTVTPVRTVWGAS